MSDKNEHELQLEETHIDVADEKWAAVQLEATRAEQHEQSLTLFQALKQYKASAFWAAAISMTIVMEGYDMALLGALYALPAFREKFGDYVNAKSGYQVSAPWQVGFAQGANCGKILGSYLGSPLIERFGYRRTGIGALIFLIPWIGLVAFAPNRVALLLGEMLCGVPWGVFPIVAEAYASEVCPITLRGYLMTYVNLCAVMGQIIAAAVLLGIQNLTGVWAFRLPFCLQWVWPIPLIILLFFAPESPWWLVRHGKLEDAEKSVTRLGSEKPQDLVASMVRTTELERKSFVGGRFIDCFRGTNLRRTELSAFAWSCGVFSGMVFVTNATYFFEQAGVAVKDAFKLNLGLQSCGFFGTVFSWFLLTHFGRRPIFVGGLATLATSMLLIGCLAVAADKGNQSVKWAQAIIMLVWVFLFDLTVGPISYTIVGEASSTSQRSATLAFSRITYYVVTIVSGIITPYMLNPGKWNWKGKTGFFWFPIATIFTVWAYFRLPEFKGRSYYEIDVLFHNKISARKFSSTNVADLEPIPEHEIHEDSHA